MPDARTRKTQRSPSGSGFFNRLIVSHWRGEFDLFPATVLPVAVLLSLWGPLTWVIDSVDWVWHYQGAALASISLMVVLSVLSVWGLIGVARSAKRADEKAASWVLIHGSTTLVLLCVMATAGQFAFHARPLLNELWQLATDSGERVEIRTAKNPDRLIITGPMELGTTQRVFAALESTPGIKLIEFDSPGGAAQEGLGLAEMLLARGVDTLVIDYCASACITAFAAGQRRYIGPNAKLALHSAGNAWRKSAAAVNDKHAQFLRRQGVAEWFIERELDVPIQDIWTPSVSMLLGSGLVTDILN